MTWIVRIERIARIEPEDQLVGELDGAASTDSDVARDDRVLDRATIAALLIVATPLVIALVRLAGIRWHPTGDMAQAELHVAGFFSDPPLVGAAGRIGDILAPYGQGSHPGPALWVALAPLYLLFGRSSFALEVGMTVVQLAFVVVAVWCVRSAIGRRAALLAAVAAGTLTHAFGPLVFIEPWNPWGALFAFFCFVATVWAVIAGHHRWLPLATFAGVFALQCHVGYALLVAGGLLASMIVVWRRRNVAAAVEARDARRALTISVALGAVMWIPPLLDQWRRTNGNLGILWRHFTSSTDAGRPRGYVGIVDAGRVFAGQLAIPGPWLRGASSAAIDSVRVLPFVLAIAVVARAVSTVARWPRSAQRRSIISLFVSTGALALLGMISTARVFGEPFEYVIRWWSVIVIWAMVAVALVASRGVGARPLAVAAVLVTTLFAGFAVADAFDVEHPGARNSRLVGALVADIDIELDQEQRYLMRWHDPATLGGVPFGVLLALEKDGYDVGIDAPYAAGALPHRVLAEADADAVLWVVLGDDNIERMAMRDDVRLVAGADVRTSAEQRRSAVVRDDLDRALIDAGLPCAVGALDDQYGLAAFVLGGAPVSAQVSALAAEYTTLGLPAAVFLAPTFATPYDPPPSTC